MPMRVRAEEDLELFEDGREYTVSGVALESDVSFDFSIANSNYNLQQLSVCI